MPASRVSTLRNITEERRCLDSFHCTKDYLTFMSLDRAHSFLELLSVVQNFPDISPFIHSSTRMHVDACFRLLVLNKNKWK